MKLHHRGTGEHFAARALLRCLSTTRKNLKSKNSHKSVSQDRVPPAVARRLSHVVEVVSEFRSSESSDEADGDAKKDTARQNEPQTRREKRTKWPAISG